MDQKEEENKEQEQALDDAITEKELVKEDPAQTVPPTPIIMGR